MKDIKKTHIISLLGMILNLQGLAQVPSYIQNGDLFVTTTKGKQYNLTRLRDSLEAERQATANNKGTYSPPSFDFKLMKKIREDYYTGAFTSAELKKITFANLSEYDIYYLMLQDLLIWGRVIYHRNLSEDSCTFYKTAYGVVIDTLLWSLYPYQAGDTIEIYGISGLMGEPCMEAGGFATFEMQGEARLKVSETYLLALSKIILYSSIMRYRANGSADKVMPNTFRLYGNEHFFDRSNEVAKFLSFLNIVYEDY
jgi:hypothetical protein